MTQGRGERVSMCQSNVIKRSDGPDIRGQGGPSPELGIRTERMSHPEVEREDSSTCLQRV